MNILIVDDEPLARKRLRRMLDEIDDIGDVREAGSAKEALAAIEQNRPDLVLLDIRMHGRSGLEFAAQTPDLPPIVFTTAYDQYALEAFEVSAVDYLLKPVKPERLRSAIAKVRQRNQPVDTAALKNLLDRLDRTVQHAESSNEAPTPSGGHALERRLAAIMSADVVGYSRLMTQDEIRTIRQLTSRRKTIADLVVTRRGRVVDAPGDNLLAEFPSAVEAVRCALEIQSAMLAANATLPAPEQMRFRVGLDLGDVVAEGSRIYGDGVNIAARLEHLADPGGVLISGSVFEQVRGRIDFLCENLGEVSLRNIPTPVRAYRVDMADQASTKQASEQSASATKTTGRE